MKIFNSKRERFLETDNKVKQFTIACQDMRLSAQKYLLSAKDAYIEEADKIIQENDEEIAALKLRLSLQEELSNNYENTILLLTGENGRYDLN